MWSLFDGIGKLGKVSKTCLKKNFPYSIKYDLNLSKNFWIK
jgi:hypothetical protein